MGVAWLCAPALTLALGQAERVSVAVASSGATRAEAQSGPAPPRAELDPAERARLAEEEVAATRAELAARTAMEERLERAEAQAQEAQRALLEYKQLPPPQRSVPDDPPPPPPEKELPPPAPEPNRTQPAPEKAETAEETRDDGDAAEEVDDAPLPPPVVEHRTQKRRTGNVLSAPQKVPPRTSLTATIVGCARDAASTMQVVLADLAKLCDAFQDCRMIVYENDSADATLGELRQFQAKDKRLQVVSEQHVTKPSREQVIAHCRNRLLAEAARRPPDLLLVADLDYSAALGPPKQVLRALRVDAWDVVSFDRPDYYDLYALRCENHDRWCKASGALFGSDWKPPEYSECDPWGPSCLAGLARFGARGPRVRHKLGKKTADTYVPVLSAFGGLAMYRWNVIGECKYDGEILLPDDTVHPECEHVGFHRCLKDRGARIMIADWQLHPRAPWTTSGEHWWAGPLFRLLADLGTPFGIFFLFVCAIVLCAVGPCSKGKVKPPLKPPGPAWRVD